MAVAADAVPDAVPDAERVALPDGVLVPEIAVTEAEPDAEAEADAAEADEEAEELEFAALQLGLVFRVTPALLQRDDANLMVSSQGVSWWSSFAASEILTFDVGLAARGKNAACDIGDSLALANAANIDEVTGPQVVCAKACLLATS